MDCKGFQDFEAAHGELAAQELMEIIGESIYGSPQECVSIADKVTHNACNCTVSGVVRYGGSQYGFVADNGDWDGLVLREFLVSDKAPVYEVPQPVEYTFVIKAARPTPLMEKIYAQWKETDWFKEKVRAYNYDRHFAPGIKTETHYREWASQKGLRIARVD